MRTGGIAQFSTLKGGFMMKRRNIVAVSLFLALFLALPALRSVSAEKQKCNASYGTGDLAISVATGSPGALGLLKALAEPFCQAGDCRGNWVKKGSGASLKALEAGEVDMVMVHAPATEKKAVQEGWACMRTLLGSNEFYIVGPETDPAGISNAGSAKDAYSMIAKARARFFSRGDRELGYFMTDSSTYFAKQSKMKNLKILFKGDPILVNVYHALVASPERCPRANYALAAKFVRFVSSPEGQKIYREYGKTKYGSALYNDAEYAKKWNK